MSLVHLNDSVHWYMDELKSRVVAKSGIPSDRFHLGKVILQSLQDDPDFICQIDAGTGQSETNGSMLKRTIQCAIYFRKLGLKNGDVVVLMAPSHLDLAVPFYASMYLGLTVAPVDRTLKVGELEFTFKSYKPALILCQNEKLSDLQETLKLLNSSAKIITFDKDDHGACFADFLTANDDEIKKFKPADFDTETSIVMILPTSGSTGSPKGAAATYKTWMITGPHLWARSTTFPTPSRICLLIAPLQWLTAVTIFVNAPFMKSTRLQTSKPVTMEHLKYIINTYRPTFVASSPTMLTQLLKDEHPCDISCFDLIMIGGSAVHKEVIEEIKKVAPRTLVQNAFGMSELCTLALQGECPIESSGKPTLIYQYRLVDVETQKYILVPNVSGELWLKGPMFREYYNNPEATREAFTEDGWFKTGDMFYRDEHWNFYFVERIKLLLKYNSYQISPVEIESVIRKHPAVLDVAVTGISDSESGELPVACVIRKPSRQVTAQEIKDLVKEKLSDAKQLRGGVVFMNEFPLTASTKIHRRNLKTMIQEMKLE